MKTDREIMEKLEKEDPTFSKLYAAYAAWKEIEQKQKVYEVILLFVDQYRKDNPE